MNPSPQLNQWRAVIVLAWVSCACALLTGPGAPRPVFGGPPFVTDDPEPVPLHHWELYLAGTYSRERGGESALAPMVEVNYGAFPDVQLHLVAPFAYDHPTGEGGHFGYGDTELGIKYRPIHETERLPQVGIFPLVELPTGDEGRGLGNGKAQFFFPIWLQKSWDEGKWTTYGGGGYWVNLGDGNEDFWRVGWEIQRRLADNLVLGGEIFFETEDTRDGEDHTAFNIGAIYDIDEHSHLLLSAGRDIDGPNRFTTYVGIQFTF